MNEQTIIFSFCVEKCHKASKKDIDKKSANSYTVLALARVLEW